MTLRRISFAQGHGVFDRLSMIRSMVSVVEPSEQSESNYEKAYP